MLHLLVPRSLRSMSSSRKCGTWVLLPLPVSPATTTTRCLFRVSTMEFLCLNTGNCCLSFRSFWYLGVLCNFLKRFLTGSTSSAFSDSRDSVEESSSEAKSSHDPSERPGFSLLVSEHCRCSCFSSLSSLPRKRSRGLFVSLLLNSSFFFSASLHSSQTSR